MVAQRYRLYIERMDASRNMARFYALSIEGTLFGQTCLVRRWGRIGTTGRMVQHSFDDEGEAVGAAVLVGERDAHAPGEVGGGQRAAVLQHLV